MRFLCNIDHLILGLLSSKKKKSASDTSDATAATATTTVATKAEEDQQRPAAEKPVSNSAPASAKMAAVAGHQKVLAVSDELRAKMGNYILLPTLIPDIMRVYDIYFSAFERDDMGRIIVNILFPSGTSSPEFRKAHYDATLAWWHHCTTQHTAKCVNLDTGEIVGMALIDFFLKPRSAEERAFTSVPWLEGEQREKAEKVLRPLWEMREKLFGGRPYIYCHVAAVEPQHQGRGAGAALASWVIEGCEKFRLPVYFESSPSVVGLYELLGFQRIPETVVHSKEMLGTKEDIVVPLMVRMPQVMGKTFDEWRKEGGATQ